MSYKEKGLGLKHKNQVRKRVLEEVERDELRDFKPELKWLHF